MIHIACCSNEKLAPIKILFMKYQKASGWRHFTIQKYVFKRIIYPLFPNIKKKAWENKTYIEGGGVVSNNYQ